MQFQELDAPQSILVTDCSYRIAQVVEQTEQSAFISRLDLIDRFEKLNQPLPTLSSNPNDRSHSAASLRLGTCLVGLLRMEESQVGLFCCNLVSQLACCGSVHRSTAEKNRVKPEIVASRSETRFIGFVAFRKSDDAKGFNFVL